MKELFRNSASVYKILEMTVSAHGVDSMFTEVVEELRELFDSERCTLYVLNKEKNELYTKVAQKCDLAELHIPVDKNTIIGFSVLKGKEIFVNDVNDLSELKKVDPELKFGAQLDEKCCFRTKSVLSAPITYRGEIIGAFQAFNKRGGYLAKDLNAIREFGLILGLVLNNVLLTEELNKYRSASEGAGKGKEE